MKRSLFKLAVLALFCFSLIGSPLIFGKETISVIVSAGGSGRTFQAAANHFSEATGIDVKMVQYSYAEVREKQLLEMLSNTGSLDVISVDGQIWVAELNNYLMPLKLKEADLERFVPSMVDFFRYGKQKELYALPVRIGGWVLMYRKDLFQKANLQPPKTWDEFLDTAKKLTKDGVYGFAPALQQGNFLVAQWTPFLYSFNGHILNKAMTKVAFNDKAGQKATQFLVDLYRKHGVVPPGAISYEHDGVIAAMQQGLAAMAITYSPNFLAMNDPGKSKVAGKLAISGTIPYDSSTHLKKGITELSGWGFGVAKMSRHKEAALKFIQFITSPEEQLRLAVENTNAPTVKSVYSNPKFLNVFPAGPELLQALSNAQNRPGVPMWTNIEDELAAELSAAVNGVKTVKEALADAEKNVNQFLNKK